MFMFGIELEVLNGTGIRRLENILTLCSGLHGVVASRCGIYPGFLRRNNSHDTT